MKVHLHLHPVQALDVSPKALEITKGASKTATISGTWTPYEASSDKPTITTSITGSTLTVSADANAAASGTVTITDRKGHTIELPITTVDA